MQIVFNMNEENTKKIIEACPSMFVSYDGMPYFFGFECGDGWADLLVETCKKMQAHLITLSKELAEEIVALQVKEKYGTLRFYISSYTETLDAIVLDAETRSATICEQCGKTGKVRGDMWLYAACDVHTRDGDLDLPPQDVMP